MPPKQMIANVQIAPTTEKGSEEQPQPQKTAVSTSVSSALVARRLARRYYGPPVLPGESQLDYFHITEDITRALEPQDAIERLFVKDIADASLEIERLKHIINTMVKAKFHSLAERAILNNVEKATLDSAKTFVKLALVGGDDYLNKELEKLGINPQELIAESYSRQIDDIERFTKLIEAAEKRRSSAILVHRRYQRQRLKRLQAGHRATIDLEVNNQSSDDLS